MLLSGGKGFGDQILYNIHHLSLDLEESKDRHCEERSIVCSSVVYIRPNVGSICRLALLLCRLQDLDRKTACLLLQVGVIYVCTFLLETESSTETVYIDRPMGVL